MESKQAARPRYNYRLMTERYEKEKKFITAVTRFTPNLKAATITSKFYAYHDVIDDEEPDKELINIIQEKHERGPKSKWNNPHLESHKYGWYSEPLIEQDRNDARFYHPKTAEISKINVNLGKGSKKDASLKPFKH